MLQLNPRFVCGIVSHAREFHAQEDVMLPEEPDNQNDDWIDEALAEHADNPVYLELKNTIDELEPELQANLVALMWMGRGDYTEDEWELALQEARDNWTPRTADYLLATPMGADYLAEGLAMLGHSCEDEG
ncbi:Protein of unknown function [Ectothiorhodospira magna]|uniref:DUF3775 domain-containing protein n=1 Tax=Ectothiorhodospira magna TaxID=867345 RepID=A0A1H9BD72_9GAMM|nr:DUF3775 domain-containing protein [Ectothiorhodospira magna]SEP86990.1 Protein of unknown function [Ectothiorhodospira magna]